MSEYDVQSDLRQLRAEMQTDRLAIQTSIALGFKSIHDRIDEHIQDDNIIEGRVKVMEDRQDTFGKLFWGIYLSGLGALAAWIFH